MLKEKEMSYVSLLYNIVFRPYGSQPVINPDHAEDLYRYISGFINSRDSQLCQIGGMPDHIHLLVQIAPTQSVAAFMRDLKTSANKYMTDHRQWFPDFYKWGKSYCAITVSASNMPNVVSYIQHQKQHHAHKSYADELRDICKAYGINIDEQYFLKE